MWDELANEYHAKLNFGRVDCTADENDDLCESFDVEGYPSIYLLQSNMTYHFKGKRTYEDIYKFVFDKHYLKTQAQEIPLIQKLSGMDRFYKSSGKFLIEMGHIVEVIFDYIGLSLVPL